jgi:hypothetical protein
MLNNKKLEGLIRHINNVQDATSRLGEKLIEINEEELGLKLIANGRIHDNSKFYGIEWDYLDLETKENNIELFKAALKHHNETNPPHHPEYWVGGIKAMPEPYIAEMVCDWYARSIEFGDNVWTWAKDKASDKYGYTINTNVYREIKRYLELLLEPAFK